ncbi:MAG TPA: DUF6339 family protein [Nannocystaceae bacterium]|nr:DUF6339 family protein [Nannocystaceae bacterium]
MSLTLRSLRQDGRCLLSRDFLSGALARWPAEEVEPFLAPALRPLELAPFLEALAGCQVNPASRSEVDGPLAVAIHQALRLARREAADAGVWRYLAVVAAPEFIRARWNHEEDTFRHRFWRPGTRPDSNYYSRLWWIAELASGQDGDYERTRRVLRSQALATAIFVRGFSHYFPAVKACVDVLADRPGDVIAFAVREVYRDLALLPQEALSEEEFRRMFALALGRAP